MVIIVRYGELALKSQRVRKRFEEKLIKNIVNCLHEKQIDCIVSSIRGRIYIHTNNEKESIEILKKIFGIVSVSIAVETTSDLNQICNLSVIYSKKLIKENQTFAVRVRRTGTHKFTSQEAAAIIGGEILENILCSVNLTKPDVTIFVEIRDNKAYIYSEKISCTGGFPLGTQGKVLSLIEDKDSIVATWLIMKRGCKIIPIIYKSSSLEILKNLENWGITLQYKKLEFDEIKNFQNLKNFCVQINKIAIETKSEAFLINEKNPEFCNFKLDYLLDVPVFRPLIGMGNKEIEKLNQKIGLGQ